MLRCSINCPCDALWEPRRKGDGRAGILKGTNEVAGEATPSGAFHRPGLQIGAPNQGKGPSRSTLSRRKCGGRTGPPQEMTKTCTDSLSRKKCRWPKTIWEKKRIKNSKNYSISLTIKDVRPKIRDRVPSGRSRSKGGVYGSGTQGDGPRPPVL